MHDTISKYNGWCNRETWLVNLWLTNDVDSSSVLEQASQRAGDLYAKAEWLETMIQESFQRVQPEASLWSDLMGTALNRVNWYELIENN